MSVKVNNVKSAVLGILGLDYVSSDPKITWTISELQNRIEEYGFTSPTHQSLFKSTRDLNNTHLTRVYNKGGWNYSLLTDEKVLKEVQAYAQLFSLELQSKSLVRTED